MKNNDSTNCNIRKEGEEKDNIIGSLRNDTAKLYYSNDTLRRRISELKKRLNSENISRIKVTKELQKVKKSSSWKIVQIVIKAFQKPGINTVLLPLRLLNLVCALLHEKWHNPRVKESGEQDNKAQAYSLPSEEPSPQVSANPFLLRKGITANNLSSLRVACIMDEFTYKSFLPECRLLQLTPDKWEDEMKCFDPDMLFVQSAWAGKDHLWLGKIKHPGHHLKQLVEWCKKHDIPTIFRSTEDPPHFKEFLPAAGLCDIVFTTDSNCIEKYRSLLASDRVYLLPFAAQPRRFNPVEKYKRKKAFCFAGAYYHHYPERKKDFEFLFETLSGIAEVDIFDRNYHKKENLMIFPERFKHRILGDLAYDQIDMAYKGYFFGININSVTQSPTMFARRVYELLASNTVVVSNYSEGVRNLFGDLVISASNSKNLRQKLEKLTTDGVFYRKFTLLGLRKVLQEHTYGDRLAVVAHKIWDIPCKRETSHVSVLASVNNCIELDLIMKSYQRQIYSQKSLFIIKATPFEIPPSFYRDSITFFTLEEASLVCIKEIAAKGFVACFLHNDYYGSNYIVDIVLSTQYSSAAVIGKGAFYEHRNDEFILENSQKRFSYTKKLQLRCCLFSVKMFQDRDLAGFVERLATGYIEDPNCLSIDEFNYCQNYTDSCCEIVDDLYLENCGCRL